MLNPSPAVKVASSVLPVVAIWAAVLLSLSLILAALIPQILVGVEADRLFTFAFLKDVFLDSGHISAWNFGQHSDLFPDKLLASIAFLITRKVEFWLLAYTAASVGLYFAVALTFFVLRRHAAYPHASLNAAPLLLAFVVTVGSLLAWKQGLFVLFLSDLSYPSHHYAASLSSILGCLIAIDSFSGGVPTIAKRVPVAVAILFLTTVSDKIAIPVSLPSFAGALIYYGAVTRRVSMGMLIAALGVVGAIGIAFLVGDKLNNMLAQVSHLPLKLNLAGAVQQSEIFYQAFFSPLNPVQFWCGTILVASSAVLIVIYTSSAACIMLGRKPSMTPDQARAGAFIVFLVATSVLNPIAIVAVGAMEEVAHARESVATLFCLLWAVAAQLDRGPLTRAPRWTIAVITATVALLSCAAVRGKNIGDALSETVHVPLLQCIYYYKASYPLRRGLGFHWDTLPITLFSQGQTTILTVMHDARIWHWVNSLDWYAPRPDDDPFTFVVLDPMMINEKTLVERVGVPAQVLNCADAGNDAGTKTIWVFDATSARRLTNWVTEQYRYMKSLQANR